MSILLLKTVKVQTMQRMARPACSSGATTRYVDAHVRCPEGQQESIQSDERVCAALQMCEIEVLHKSASRVHACIAFDSKQQPFVVDLSSTHGEPFGGTKLKTPILLRCRKIDHVKQYSSNDLRRKRL